MYFNRIIEHFALEETSAGHLVSNLTQNFYAQALLTTNPKCSFHDHAFSTLL